MSEPAPFSQDPDAASLGSTGGSSLAGLALADLAPRLTVPDTPCFRQIYEVLVEKTHHQSYGRKIQENLHLP